MLTNRSVDWAYMLCPHHTYGAGQWLRRHRNGYEKMNLNFFMLLKWLPSKRTFQSPACTYSPVRYLMWFHLSLSIPFTWHLTLIYLLGWSTSVPTYNPREIIANLRLMIAGEDPHEMHPWYRGFKGNTQPHNYLIMPYLIFTAHALNA